MGQAKQRFTFSYFAVCNLIRQPSRTAALMFLVSVLSFVLSAGSLITLSLQNGTNALSRRLGADLLIVPNGYEQKTEGILLGGKPSTFYMDVSWVEKISKMKGVQSASPQLFVASLAADCCSANVQIIGFDQATDFTIKPWIQSSLPGPLSMDKIVIGGAVSGSVGSKLKFLGRNYTVAAKMARTGTGFDNSVFMSIEAAQRAANDYVLKIGGAKVPAHAVSSITILLQNGYSTGDVEEDIDSEVDSGKQNVSVIPSEEVVGSVSESLRSTINLVAILAALLWIFAILILDIVFSAILHERKREFGLLRSLGATKNRLAYLVLLESGEISLSGGVLGIAFCALLIPPFQAYIQHALNMPYLQPSIPQFLIIAAASLIVSFAVGPLSSLSSVFKICKKDAYWVIRDGDI
jgi:putative ABC transport system permease protein